jgi:hypothetical protein
MNNERIQVSYIEADKNISSIGISGATIILTPNDTGNYFDQPRLVFSDAGLLKSTGPQASLEYRSIILGVNITDSSNGADLNKIYSGQNAPLITLTAGPAAYSQRDGVTISNNKSATDINEYDHILFIDTNTGSNTYGGVKIGGLTSSNIAKDGTNPIAPGFLLDVSGNIKADNIIYNTGNQNISGQKRFIDEDIISSTSPTLGQPTTFIGGFSGPGIFRFETRPEYRPVVFPNPNYFYTGVNAGQPVEIYFNTGTSRWWFTVNNSFVDASPIVQSSSLSARLPLNNWSGGNMRIYPTYPHNISHQADGYDPINPILINAVATTGGNQTISGVKTFINNQTFSGNINVSGTGIFNALDLNNVDDLSISGVSITLNNGNITYSVSPRTSGISFIPDANLYTFFDYVLTGNATLNAPTNMNNGQSITIFLNQDSSGSRSVSFNNAYLFSNGINPSLNFVPSGVDIMQVIRVNNKYFCTFASNY